MGSFLENQAITIQGRLPGKQFQSGRTYVNRLDDDIKDRFKKAMFKSKGKANNPLCLELAINEVPTDTIVKIADILDKNDYYRYESSYVKDQKGTMAETRVMGYDKTRGLKKVPGFRRLGYDRQFKNADTVLGRRMREFFGDMLVRPGVDRWHGIVGWYNNGTCINGCGISTEASEKAIPVIYFTKYDEAKRQKILKDEITKELVLTRNYQNFVPTELKEKGVTEKAFVQQQTTKYFDELYAMTQISEKLEMPESGINGERRFMTLSEVGYNWSKIKDAQTLALIETVYMSMEGLGIGLYHQPVGYRGDAPRGYKRLLQKINQAYKQFGTLMRKGFDADTARATVIEQLRFWIDEWKNTDQKWVVFTRKDWVKPEQTKKKATSTGSATRTTKKVASLEDALSVLNKTEE